MLDRLGEITKSPGIRETQTNWAPVLNRESKHTLSFYFPLQIIIFNPHIRIALKLAETNFGSLKLSAEAEGPAMFAEGILFKGLSWTSYGWGCNEFRTRSHSIILESRFKILPRLKRAAACASYPSIEKASWVTAEHKFISI